MSYKKVLFLSKSWQSDHPVLLRWKNYYESRGILFYQLNINWNIYYPDRKRKIMQIFTILLWLFKYRVFFIHANDLESGMLACKLKKILRLPFVFDSHEIYSHEYPNEIESKFYFEKKLIAERKILITANMVVVPNSQRITFFKKIHPETDKINYVLIENKSLLSTNKHVNSKYTQYLQGLKNIYYGGTYWVGRKQESFGDLAKSLKKNGIQLVLSGSINEYLEKILIGNDIIFVGNIPVDEYIDFVRHNDISLAWYFPTTINDELCAPLKIFDYLVARKPILAPKLPYIEELSIRFKGAIVLFEPGNWEDCLKKAIEIVENYDIYIEAINKIPFNDISWENQYSTIDNLFKSAKINLCVV